jgi:hypothetical protein
MSRFEPGTSRLQSRNGQSCKWENDIKVDIRETEFKDWRVRIGFIWLRIGTAVGSF